MLILLLSLATLQATGARATATSAGDIRLEADAPMGPFQIGERVALGLSLTDPDRKESSPLRIDVGAGEDQPFRVEPQTGWTRLYPTSPDGVSIYSGDKRSIDLNPWIRFDQPGVYRVRVLARVETRNVPYTERAAILSNEFEVTVLPATREWQERTLARAIAVLADTPPAKGELSGAQDEAVRTERYLGTPEAVVQLARGLRGDNALVDLRFAAGIAASPHPAAALQEMRRLIRDPDHPVTDPFVLALRRLSPHPTIAEQRALPEEILASVPEKRGRALALTITTLLDSPLSAGILTPDRMRQLAPALLSVFLDLPAQFQYRFLNHRWGLFRGLDVLPVLRRCARECETPYYGNDGWRQYTPGSEALRRWNELAPVEARAFVLEELARPDPRYDAKALMILKDATLPEVEQELVHRLAAPEKRRNSKEDPAALLTRYATRAILPQMVSAYDQDRKELSWSCETKVAVLAYLMRVDPGAALQRFEEAGPSARTCDHTMLGPFASPETRKKLEEIAIRDVSTGRPLVVRPAAKYLERNGSARAEEALVDRYFRSCDRGEDVLGAGAAFCAHLMDSIVGGLGWIVDDKLLDRLSRARGLPSEYVDDRIGFLRKEWSHRPWHAWGALGGDSFGVLWYRLESLDQLEDKLSQFPVGSSFSLSFAEAEEGDGERQRFYEREGEFLNAHGMTLIEEVPPGGRPVTP
jgi:hypothetical protein